MLKPFTVYSRDCSRAAPDTRTRHKRIDVHTPHSLTHTPTVSTQSISSSAPAAPWGRSRCFRRPTNSSSRLGATVAARARAAATGSGLLVFGAFTVRDLGASLSASASIATIAAATAVASASAGPVGARSSAAGGISGISPCASGLDSSWTLAARFPPRGSPPPPPLPRSARSARSLPLRPPTRRCFPDDWGVNEPPMWMKPSRRCHKRRRWTAHALTPLSTATSHTMSA